MFMQVLVDRILLDQEEPKKKTLDLRNIGKKDTE